jgi:CSLREA domain-containing protein
VKRISPSRNYEVLSAVRTFLFVLGSYYLFAGLVMAQTPATLTRIAPQKLYLQEEKPLTLTYVGNPASVHSLTSGLAKPLSLASGDFDGDGVEDLIAGYAVPKGGLLVIHRGNLDAFAPQSQKSMQAIGQEQFPSPFLPQANVVELLETPDFLATGSFDTVGHLSLVVGARGSHTVYFLPGDGRGGFLAPQTISLSGSLTALGAVHFDPTTMQSDVLAGISTDTGNELVVLESKSSGWGPVAIASLSGTATSFAFGDLDRNGFPSAAVVAGGEVFILHGAAVHSARTGEGPSILLAERLALPVSAVSATIGSFLPDRAQKLQIAVLAADGSTQIVTRTNLDTRPWSLAEMIARRRAQIDRKTDPYAVSLDPNEGWQVAESLPAVVAASGSGQTPVLLRTRISDRATDDLMLLDTRIPGVHVFAHESVAAPAAGTLASNQIPPSVHLSLPMTSSQIPVAGLSMRVNIDGRAGVVLLKTGQVAPQVMMPLPDPTFFVNKFTDPVPGSTSTTCNNTSFADVSSSCSLREAILKANADVGTDTIMVPAGTITIQQPRVAGNYTGQTGTFEITNSMNIVGSVDGTGKPASILQAGTTASNGIDKVMSINQDI